MNLEGYDQMIDAAAAVTQKFAYSTLTVNGNELAKKRVRVKRHAPPGLIGHHSAR